ncbi:hypothetical protein CGLO_13348 [Colletotrichum gloeosporioides Cg-14]|uniref:Uncharacterized protein n=1 Tax=Colletotrichum gloeosporioides (strain Cg-14) TaxID=1237896 RepID=T0LH46_COLGC|nr:hypothetical protein CGLO_13348 [Colletotrichum gloeosporioides Cg-14]
MILFFAICWFFSAVKLVKELISFSTLTTF